MIFRSIIISLFLFCTWSIVLLFFKDANTYQSQWKQNIVTAEEYIFSDVKIENLIIGSSLSSKIETGNMDGFYNLAFSGQAIYDGLNILKVATNLPERVFIEINLIDRDQQEQFKEITCSYLLNRVKYNLIALRSKNQPAGYLVNGVLKPIFSALYNGNDTLKEEKSIEKHSRRQKKDALFESMVTLKKAQYTNFDTLNLCSRFDVLKEHIDYLSSKNVEIVFFEMPINEKLQTLNKALLIRRFIQKEFSNFLLIPAPKEASSYRTTDGFHLTQQEANLYTKYFKDQIRKVIHQPQ